MQGGGSSSSASSSTGVSWNRSKVRRTISPASGTISGYCESNWASVSAQFSSTERAPSMMSTSMLSGSSGSGSPFTDIGTSTRMHRKRGPARLNRPLGMAPRDTERYTLSSVYVTGKATASVRCDRVSSRRAIEAVSSSFSPSFSASTHNISPGSIHRPAIVNDQRGPEAVPGFQRVQSLGLERLMNGEGQHRGVAERTPHQQSQPLHRRMPRRGTRAAVWTLSA